MWQVGLAVVLVVGVLGPAPRAVAKTDNSPGGVQSDGAGGGQVVAFSFEVVTTSASGGSDGGTTTSSSASGGAYVQPTCWYESRGTGAETAEERRRVTERDPSAGKALSLVAPDERDAMAHAADNGRWYQMHCDTSTAEGRALVKEVVNTALSVFTTLVAAGISAATEGAAAPALAWGVGSTIVKPIVADGLTSAWGVPKSDASTPGSDYFDRLKVQAYSDAANRNLLTSRSVDTMRNQDWFNRDSYAHPDVKPFPSASTMSSEHVEEVTEWALEAEAPTSTDSGDPAIKALREAVESGSVEANKHIRANPPRKN